MGVYQVQTRRMRASNSMLEERVRQSTEELAGANKELRQTADALQEKTSLLEAILNSMGEGVVVADSNAKYLLFNPAAVHIIGMGPTDGPPEKWPEIFGIFHPDTMALQPVQTRNCAKQRMLYRRKQASWKPSSTVWVRAS